jgi:hypothetical protein
MVANRNRAKYLEGKKKVGKMLLAVSSSHSYIQNVTQDNKANIRAPSTLWLISLKATKSKSPNMPNTPASINIWL